VKASRAAKEYWKTLGPGLVTGAADDDPSGIATYSQIGARSGFGLIWLSVLTYPLMSVVQEMCARIGIVTGVGLAANIKRHYPAKALYFCTLLLLCANVFNIGADLGAMAESTRLILPYANYALLVIFFGLFSLILQIFVPYKKYSKVLKFLALSLVAYIFSAILVKINWPEAVEHAFVPALHFSKGEIILICAALGTTISPYLFFWQSSQEVEEEIMKGELTEDDRRSGASPETLKKMRTDVWSGMLFSNLVMFFIIAAAAGTLFASGITNINTAGDAALALRPFAGNLAFWVFALGIIGTGLLSIPVLSGSASYAVSESFGWSEGLYQKWKQAAAFYTVIALSMVAGIAFNFFGFDPIKMLIYSAVLNGIIAPIILFFVIRLSSRADVMGGFRSSRLSILFGWITAGIMLVAGVMAIVSLLV
jgi:NRAMP (natural resistance-associated macrophage protein)-like metal ion transporter